jgi:hypothetical protein
VRQLRREGKLRGSLLETRPELLGRRDAVHTLAQHGFAIVGAMVERNEHMIRLMIAPGLNDHENELGTDKYEVGSKEEATVAMSRTMDAWIATKGGLDGVRMMLAGAMMQGEE